MHAHESVGGIPQQNMPQRHRTWQTEADVGIRRMIVEKMWVWVLAFTLLLLFSHNDCINALTKSDIGICGPNSCGFFFASSLLLFQKKKPRVSPEWQQRLPDFVKRLEESLYRDALSKVIRDHFIKSNPWIVKKTEYWNCVLRRSMQIFPRWNNAYKQLQSRLVQLEVIPTLQPRVWMHLHLLWCLPQGRHLLFLVGARWYQLQGRMLLRSQTQEQVQWMWMEQAVWPYQTLILL